MEASYAIANASEEDSIRAVTSFMVNVFNGEAIMHRLNDPNNRRKDLGVVCLSDGIHIRWHEEKPSNWTLGYGEEVIPYAAAKTNYPKSQLTSELLSRLERSVHSGIVNYTQFEKNQYGCFAPGNNRPHLY